MMRHTIKYVALSSDRIPEIAQRIDSDIVFRDLFERIYQELRLENLKSSTEFVVHSSSSYLDWCDAFGYAVYIREHETAFQTELKDTPFAGIAEQRVGYVGSHLQEYRTLDGRIIRVQTPLSLTPKE